MKKTTNKGKQLKKSAKKIKKAKSLTAKISASSKTKKVKKITAPKKTTIKSKKSTIKPLKKTKEHKKATPSNKRAKSRYTAAELQNFKKILLEEKRKILESARANMRSLVDSESGDYVGDDLSYATHMAEQGTDEMEREKNYMFVQRDEKYLGYIEEALMRIDQGTYGICIDCLEVPKYLCKTCPLIPKERLELVPITQHCIECKNLRG